MIDRKIKSSLRLLLFYVVFFFRITITILIVINKIIIDNRKKNIYMYKRSIHVIRTVVDIRYYN